MTDLGEYSLLSKHSLVELMADFFGVDVRTLYRWKEAQREVMNAEIERRKAEPDYAAWEPKLAAFRKEMGRGGGVAEFQEFGLDRFYIRALITAHNTPLAGEWTEFAFSSEWPVEVTSTEYEVEVKNIDGAWEKYAYQPCWAITAYRYRYRPRQS